MELWHTKTVEQTRDALQSTEQGLSAEQVRSATQKHGLNELRHKKPKSVGKLFLEQMTDVMILVLLAAAAISAFLGEVIDSAVILFIVILNAVIGVVQQKKAETAAQLLTSTDLPISEIAESLGFISPFYFSNFFKKRTGMTPSTYRNIYLRTHLQ